jgi:hypothetical protein
MKPEFSGQIFEKYSNIKFHENPSNGSRVFFPCGQTDGQRETDLKELTFVLRSFAKEPATLKAQQFLSTFWGHVGALYGVRI